MAHVSPIDSTAVSPQVVAIFTRSRDREPLTSRISPLEAKGDIDAAGKVGICSGCHTVATNNDWVFTQPVR